MLSIDNDLSFKANDVQNFLSEFSVKDGFHVAHHHEAAGIVENRNKFDYQIIPNVFI